MLKHLQTQNSVQKTIPYPVFSQIDTPTSNITNGPLKSGHGHLRATRATGVARTGPYDGPASLHMCRKWPQNENLRLSAASNTGRLLFYRDVYEYGMTKKSAFIHRLRCMTV